MVENKRKIFGIADHDIDKYLATSIEKIVDNLLELEKKYSEQGWSSLHLKSYDCGYDGGVEFKLCGMREETEEEFQKRIQTEKSNLEKEEKKLVIKIKKEYNALLGTGMFFEFFPGYNGEWDKDKEQFINFYKTREANKK